MQDKEWEICNFFDEPTIVHVRKSESHWLGSRPFGHVECSVSYKKMEEYNVHWIGCSWVWHFVGKRVKKVSFLVFDFACHPCTGSHANLLCILSCLCNAQPEGWATSWRKLCDTYTPLLIPTRRPTHPLVPTPNPAPISHAPSKVPCSGTPSGQPAVCLFAFFSDLQTILPSRPLPAWTFLSSFPTNQQQLFEMNSEPHHIVLQPTKQ